MSQGLRAQGGRQGASSTSTSHRTVEHWLVDGGGPYASATASGPEQHWVEGHGAELHHWSSGRALAVREGASALPLALVPGWGQTWWCRGLALAAAAAGLYVTVQVRLRRARREHLAEQAFAQRLLESQDEERKRIAAELHDGLGQDLLVIKNRALIALRDPGTSGSAVEQLSQISQLASQSLNSVREISRNLHPYHIDRLGLSKAIQAMVNAVSGSSGTRIALTLEPLDGVLPAALEIQFYRIVQELLNNILKHSYAATADIRATRHGSVLCLEVADDGRGFDPAVDARRSATQGGLGLQSVVERVRLMRGTAQCDSRPTRGTHWTIQIPIETKASAGV